MPEEVKIYKNQGRPMSTSKKGSHFESNIQTHDKDEHEILNIK